MSNKRKKYSSKFKAKVALAAETFAQPIKIHRFDDFSLKLCGSSGLFSPIKSA